jgi:PAS domain-containing protein
MIAKELKYPVKPKTTTNKACTCHSEDVTAVFMLYDDGTICECNKAAGKLLGFSPIKLTWQNVSAFLPQLAGVEIMQRERINPRLRFLSHIGYGFDMIRFSGAHFVCNLFFNEVENHGRHYLRLIARPINYTETPMVSEN